MGLDPVSSRTSGFQVVRCPRAGMALCDATILLIWRDRNPQGHTQPQARRSAMRRFADLAMVAGELQFCAKKPIFRLRC
jgi:hypothetical protein